ncbi:MAG: glycosyltransferase family 4 protein [Granulosicoccus sp.]
MTSDGRGHRDRIATSRLGFMKGVRDEIDTDTAPALNLIHEESPSKILDKPLRVLFAVDSRFPGLGGAESQALKLACALRERGIEVEFVAPRVLLSQSVTETVEGFFVQRIDYPHIRWIGSLVLMAYFARFLIANRGRFDALHIHITHLLAASAGYSKRWHAMPVTTKISGFYEFEGGVLDQSARWKPLNLLIRLGLSKVDHIQTISEQTGDKLLEAGFRHSQIKYVPNGVDTSVPPHSETNNETVTIGYCGRLREVKGVHVLLDGFAQVLQARPEQKLRLVIAGSGEILTSLQDQAESLGIAEQVDWLGRIDNTAEYFQSLTIYVQPSFAEGLPNSVMEAMVEQLPVIASDIGGNNDLIEDEVTGLLFKVGDSFSLAERLIRYLDDVELRESTALAGRNRMVEHYGFDQVVSSLSELYRA